MPARHCSAVLRCLANTASSPRTGGCMSVWSTREEVGATAGGNMDFYGNHRYGNTYVFNEKLTDIYREIRDVYPNTKFIVFATPETALMHQLIFDSGRFDDYARWLGILVDVFG